jgi:hypothetical protein
MASKAFFICTAPKRLIMGGGVAQGFDLMAGSDRGQISRYFAMWKRSPFISVTMRACGGRRSRGFELEPTGEPILMLLASLRFHGLA